jgi:hypothetical protein
MNILTINIRKQTLIFIFISVYYYEISNEILYKNKVIVDYTCTIIQIQNKI